MSVHTPNYFQTTENGITPPFIVGTVNTTQPFPTMTIPHITPLNPVFVPPFNPFTYQTFMNHPLNNGYVQIPSPHPQNGSGFH